MRRSLWVLLLVLAFAGCAEDGEPEDPLIGHCPQWQQGESWDVGGSVQGASGNGSGGSGNGSDGSGASGNGTEMRRLLEPNATELDGDVFDGVRLVLENVSGEVELMVWDVAADAPANLRDHRQEPGRQIQPVVRFSGTTERAVVEAFLNPVDRHEDLRTGPVELRWLGEGSWSGEAWALHRVCGQIV